MTGLTRKKIHTVENEDREKIDELSRRIDEVFSQTENGGIDGMSEIEVAAALILGKVYHTSSIVSAVIRSCLATASDDYVEDLLYRSYPSILHFLYYATGQNNPDAISFMWYVKTHPDIFRCRRAGCTGVILGECPLMVCPICGQKYHIVIDGLSEEMCSMCISGNMKTSGKPECSKITRRKAYQIFCTMPGRIGANNQ